MASFVKSPTQHQSLIIVAKNHKIAAPIAEIKIPPKVKLVSITICLIGNVITVTAEKAGNGLDIADCHFPAHGLSEGEVWRIDAFHVMEAC